MNLNERIFGLTKLYTETKYNFEVFHRTVSQIIVKHDVKSISKPFFVLFLCRLDSKIRVIDDLQIN